MHKPFACIRCGARLKSSDVQRCPKCKQVVLRTINCSIQIERLLSAQKGALSFYGHDRKRHCAVFVRVLLGTATADLVDRLINEANFLRGAKSTSGLPALHAAERIRETGGAFIASTFIEGTSITNTLNSSTLPEKARLFIMMLHVLRMVHALGYVHCDINPRHFIMRPGGQIFLVDFFSVQKSGSISHGSGSWGYQAPEQRSKCDTVSQATDVFVMGMWLYQVLTGMQPYPPRKLLSPKYRMPLPSYYSTSITPGMEATLMKSLARELSERFSDADQMLAALNHCVGRKTIIDDSGILYESIWAMTLSFLINAFKDTPVPDRATTELLLFLLACSRNIGRYLLGGMVVLGIAGAILAGYIHNLSRAPAAAEIIEFQSESNNAVQQLLPAIQEEKEIPMDTTTTLPEVTQMPPSKSYVSFFTWPASKVSINGVAPFEAPDPTEYEIISGTAQIHFSPKDGGKSMDYTLSNLQTEKHYRVEVNLKTMSVIVEDK